MKNRSNESDFAPHMQDLSSILTPERLDGTSYPEWHQNGKNVKSPKDNSTTATGFVGTFQPICGFSVTTKGNNWIIDTSAANHMTCDRNMFTQFSSNSFVSVIINTNGASSPVMGSRTVSISPLLSISNVLFCSFSQLQFSLC